MTRQEALRANATTYLGKPCKYGHAGLRQLGNRSCVECHRLSGCAWRAANPEAKREEAYAWRRKNPEAFRAIERRAKRKYMRERRAKDIDFRLKHALRCRLSKAVRSSGIKAVSAVRDLGCSIPVFREHLAARFQPGMDWDNYGRWEIDHIKPLAAFDLRDETQAKQATHYTNLQPLWAADNLLKRAQYAPGG